MAGPNKPMQRTAFRPPLIGRDVIHPRSGNFKCILVYTVVFVCILNVDNIQLKGWRHVQNGNIEAR